jgi:hypothetical protein
VNKVKPVVKFPLFLGWRLNVPEEKKEYEKQQKICVLGSSDEVTL